MTLMRLTTIVLFGFTAISCGKNVDKQLERVNSSLRPVSSIANSVQEAEARLLKTDKEESEQIERNEIEAGLDVINNPNFTGLDDEKQKQMSKVLSEAGCDMEVDGSLKDNSGRPVTMEDATNFSMKVSGESCPISLTMKFEKKGEMSNNSISFALSMEVIESVDSSREYTELAKIKKMDIDFKFSFSLSMMEPKFDGRGQGSISYVDGSTLRFKRDITADIDRDGKKLTLTDRTELKYPDETIEVVSIGKAESGKKEKTEYKVNGKSLNDKEIQKLFEELGLIGPMVLPNRLNENSDI